MSIMVRTTVAETADQSLRSRLAGVFRSPATNSIRFIPSFWHLERRKLMLRTNQQAMPNVGHSARLALAAQRPSEVRLDCTRSRRRVRARWWKPASIWRETRTTAYRVAGASRCCKQRATNRWSNLARRPAQRANAAVGDESIWREDCDQLPERALLLGLRTRIETPCSTHLCFPRGSRWERNCCPEASLEALQGRALRARSSATR